MSVKNIVTLEDKDPEEIHPYSLDCTPISYIGDGSQVISSVVWRIYNDEDSPSSYTDLSGTMKVSDSFSGNVVTCLVQGGTDGETYIIGAYITCSNGAKPLVLGRFRVKEVG